MADYIYENDFNHLWGMLQPGASVPVWPVTINCQSFLLPDRRVKPVTSEFWLTPAHWAVCARIKWGTDAKVELDFKGTSWYSVKVPFLHLIFSLHQSVRSWLTLAGDDPSLPFHEDRQFAPDRLKHFLLTEFTSEDNRTDRHAINNLLVPMILNGDIPKPPVDQYPDHKFALSSMLYLLGLLPDEPAATKEDKSPLAARHKVILVDDQAEHGWKEWVQGIVGHNHECFESKHPKDFWGRLKNKESRREFARTTLLLDLRLGSDLAMKVTHEFIKNFQQWLQLAEPLGKEVVRSFERDKSNLDKISKRAMVGPLSRALQNIESTISTTLLARLVAVILPRTPIVIFSSTQDAAILKRLEMFPNVITTFTKGTITQATDVSFREHTTASLRKCISTANRLLRVAEAAEWVEDNNIISASASAPANDARAAHVELYADESGKDPMTVGGIVAVFRGKTAADALQAAHEFNHVCLNSYFAPFEFGPNRCLRPRGGIGNAFRKSLLEEMAPQMVSAITLAGHKDQAILMTRLVELFVSLVLPSLKETTGVQDLTFSVYLPTRTVPAKYVKGGEVYPYRFGTDAGESASGEKLLYLTGDDLAGNLVRDAIDRLGPRGKYIAKLVQALTVRLAYARNYDRHRYTSVKTVLHHEKQERDRIRVGSGKKRQAVEDELFAGGWEPDCRALHYVADEVVGGGRCAEFLPWSFADAVNPGTMNILNAAELMNRAKGPDRPTVLGEALIKIANVGADSRSEYPLCQLAMRNLYRLAGNTWHQTVSAAFRGAKELK